MKEKLAIANQMRASRKGFSNNPEYQKLCSKCYRVYVFECIVKGKENFKISFGGEYIQSFSERLYNWCRYIRNSIYRLYLIHFTPDDDRTFKKWNLIHCGVSKPDHFKIAKTPNENVLYTFLEQNGFKITEEHLSNDSTVYDVVRA